MNSASYENFYFPSLLLLATVHPRWLHHRYPHSLNYFVISPPLRAFPSVDEPRLTINDIPHAPSQVVAPTSFPPPVSHLALFASVPASEQAGSLSSTFSIHWTLNPLLSHQDKFPKASKMIAFF